MTSELLTVEDAAARLKINPQTVRRWIRRGLLPAAKVGGRQWRIRSADLEARVAGSHPAQAWRRTEAVERLLALRQRLSGRGVSVDDLVAASREELERRGAPGSH